MIRIGMVGDIGSGKSHIAKLFGYPVFNADAEVGKLYKKSRRCYTKLKKALPYYIKSFPVEKKKLLEAIMDNKKNDFVHFYQSIDVLIIDDVQFLCGKEKTQDVFFHIFNHLHQNKKQVILTSDKAPVDIIGMEQRLLSRFKWGLSADLQSPDLETRLAILKKKIKQMMDDYQVEQLF